MGKVRINNFFLAQRVYLEFILQKCLLSSPLHFIWLLSKSLNLIGCQGDKKGRFKKKKVKNLKNHKVGEDFTFHTCLWHYPVHEL